MKHFFFLLCAVAFNSYAQSEGPYRESKAQGHLAKPAQVQFSEDLLKKIKLPQGVKVSVFAKDLGAPRMMVQDEEGNIYVSRPSTGDILKFKNGTQTQEVFVKGHDKVHGLAIADGKLYFVATKKIYSVDLKDASKIKLIIDDLPNVGQHENRSIAIGPDHKLYVSFKRTFNVVFHAAGAVGDGVIEAVKEKNKMAVGVDRDQNYLAPKNVITSSMKRIDNAIFNVVKDFNAGTYKGGTTIEYGLKDGAVDIAPTTSKMVPSVLLEEVAKIKKLIVDGKIKVPSTEKAYTAFAKTVK